MPRANAPPSPSLFPIAFSRCFPHFPPVTISRHFHGWDVSPLPAAVDVLTRPWAKRNFQGPLDLRDCLVLVPTRHASRRLRAELARFAAHKGSAVLSGSIVTPEHLIPLPANAASDVLVLALLAQRLLGQHRALQALFPVPSAEWTFALALGIAEQLQEVRRQLADSDRSAADLLSAVPDEEKARWTNIAQLENGLLKDLAPLGLRDPLHA